MTSQHPADSTEGGPPGAPGSHSVERPVSLRWSLVALVALCVVPLAASALLLVWLQYRQGWQRVRQETLLEARSRAAELDREFAAMISGMKALAAAPELARGDLEAWHARAGAVALTQNIDNYVLTDAMGRQRVNTLRPWGSPLPASGTPPQLAQVFTTGLPVITDLFIGPVTGRPVMAIGVPVEHEGTVQYSLNIGLAPRRLQGLLEKSALPDGWVAAVLDANGTIVARTREPERFIGQRVAREVAAQTQGAREGGIEAVTLDGVPVVSSFSRSALSNWSVVVGAPRAQLERQLLELMFAAAIGVAAATLAGTGLALRIVRRVTSAVDGLNDAAGALVDGRPVLLPRLQLVEAEAVGQALLKASAVLRDTRHAAQHDPLTGMSNRALFGDLLDRQLAGAARRHGTFAVLALDLDDLKRINDEEGHAVGDCALRATARRILHSTRAADAAARVGGDEFVVLLDDADEEQARHTAARLLVALADPDDEYPRALSASIGVATWPAAGRDAATLLGAADAALYAAKRSGKGHVRVAPPRSSLTPA